MKTVDIIDTYKEAITEKREYTQILAYTYTKGLCKEEDIAKDLKLSLAETIALIRDLFKNEFVKVFDNYISLTKKSVSVLEELDFGNICTDYLLENNVSKKIDLLFLKLYSQSSLSKSKDIPNTIRLRNLFKTIDFLEFKVNQKDKQFLIWTSILGDDEYLKTEDKKLLVQKVFDFHEKEQTDLWLSYKDILAENEKYFIEKSYSCKTFYDKSNEIVILSEGKIPNDHRIILSSRFLNFFEDEVIDVDLKNVWKADHKQIEKLIFKIMPSDKKYLYRWNAYFDRFAYYNDILVSPNVVKHYKLKRKKNKLPDSKQNALSSFIQLVSKWILASSKIK